MNKIPLILSMLCLLIFPESCNSNKTDKSSASTGKFSTGSKEFNKKLDMQCDIPVLTATVDGNHPFRSCNAEAHLVVNELDFFGTSGRDIVGFHFFAKKDEVTPGTYKIGPVKLGKRGKLLVPEGQPCYVSGGFFLDGTGAKSHYELPIDGNITLDIADGQRYKGTFEMTVEQGKTKERLKISGGAFDLQYNPKGNRDLKLDKIKITKGKKEDN